jgi:uncharacterized membrane protein YjgN (DUF898 family)
MAQKYRFVSTLAIGDIILQTLVWIILAVFTLGIALPFYGYFFARKIINSTEMHEIT